MNSRIETEQLIFQEKKTIEKGFSEVLGSDNIFAREVAQPLFDSEIIIIGLTERLDYDSGVTKRNMHRFTLLLQGEMDIRVGQRTKSIRCGDIVYVSPNTLFSRRSSGPVWFLYIDIEDSVLWKPLKRNNSYVRKYEHCMLMFSLLRNILDAKNNNGVATKVLALQNSHALVNLLMYEVALADKGSSSIESLAMHKVVDQIAHEPEKKWTLKDMAEELSVSVSHLTYLFRKIYGVSPMEIVIKQRMSKASRLLTYSELKLEEVSENVGYESVYSFTRLFKKHIGISPIKYRKQFKKS